MNIKDVTGHIRQARNVTFIIGAGASISAGIPNARDLVWRIRRDNSHCLGHLDEAGRNDYGKAMAALSPGDREALIQPLLDESRLNWGHVALACVLLQPQVRRVLTFNFDFLLERALVLLGEHLPVYDFGVSPTREIQRLADKAIVHLHGQSYGLRLLNSEGETADHARELGPLLSDSLRNHLTVVIGYSGSVDAAFPSMVEAYNSMFPLLWLGHDREPADHLEPLLGKDYATYVGGCDFDRVMIEIARGLDCWPPVIFTNPPMHVRQLLGEMPDFPVCNKAGPDVLSETRRRLGEAADSWEAGRSIEEQAADAFLAGDAAPDLDLSLTSEKLREFVAWSLVNEGVSLRTEAEALDGVVRSEKLAEACEKYEAALKIKTDMHAALNNWGNALAAQAVALKGAERLKKLAEAREKYAEAIAIKPDHDDALYNWGIALLDEAMAMDGAARSEKLDEACAKFAAALEIKPDDHAALHSWGYARVEQTRTVGRTERSEKLAEACAKYAEATAIKPDKHEALTNWGVALALEAVELNGSARADKFTEAREKFEVALKIKPNDYDALANWGASLVSEAEALDGGARAAKLAEAEERICEAEAISGKPSYNLARVYALLGEVVAALDKLEACAIAETLPNTAALKADLEALRGEPRFKAFLNRDGGAG